MVRFAAKNGKKRKIDMQVWKIGNTATSLILQGFRCPFPLATERQRLATPKATELQHVAAF